VFLKTQTSRTNVWTCRAATRPGSVVVGTPHSGDFFFSTILRDFRSLSETLVSDVAATRNLGPDHLHSYPYSPVGKLPTPETSELRMSHDP
jgi:hypothetical protein